MHKKSKKRLGRFCAIMDFALSWERFQTVSDNPFFFLASAEYGHDGFVLLPFGGWLWDNIS